MSAPTPQDIQAWIRKTTENAGCGTPIYDGWDNRLWSRPYNEIVEYLKGRFESTLSEPEYYLCMLYLTKSFEKDALLIPFKQSRQHLDIIGLDVCISHSKNIPDTYQKTAKTYRNFTVRR